MLNEPFFYQRLKIRAENENVRNYGYTVNEYTFTKQSEIHEIRITVPQKHVDAKQFNFFQQKFTKLSH